MTEYISELGKTLSGRMLDIWHRRAAGLTQEQQEAYRERWLRRNGQKPVYQLTPPMVAVQPWPVPVVQPTSERLLITVAVGKRALKELEFTGPRMRRYAERIGADFVAITDRTQNDWPMAEKWRVSDYAQYYRRTAYIDCDVWIADHAGDVFESVPDSVPVAMTDDLPHLTKRDWLDYEVSGLLKSQGLPNVKFDRCLNSGVILGNATSFSHYAPPERPFPSYHCSEQNWHQYRLMQSGLTVGELPARFNWEFIRADFWEGVRDASFVHLNACKPWEYRLTLFDRFERGDFTPTYAPAPRSADPVENWRPVWWRSPGAATSRRSIPCKHLGEFPLSKAEEESVGLVRRGPAWFRCELGHGERGHVRTCVECQSCNDYATVEHTT